MANIFRNYFLISFFNYIKNICNIIFIFLLFKTKIYKHIKYFFFIENKTIILIFT